MKLDSRFLRPSHQSLKLRTSTLSNSMALKRKGIEDRHCKYEEEWISEERMQLGRRVVTLETAYPAQVCC